MTSEILAGVLRKLRLCDLSVPGNFLLLADARELPPLLTALRARTTRPAPPLVARSAKEALIRQACLEAMPAAAAPEPREIVVACSGGGALTTSPSGVTALDVSLAELAAALRTRARLWADAAIADAPLLSADAATLEADRRRRLAAASCVPPGGTALLVSHLSTGAQLLDAVAVAQHALSPEGCLVALAPAGAALPPALRKDLQWRFGALSWRAHEGRRLLLCRGTGAVACGIADRRASPAARQASGARRPAQWAPVKGSTRREQRTQRYRSVSPNFTNAPWTGEALAAHLAAEKARRQRAEREEDNLFGLSYDFATTGRHHTNIED